MDRSWEERGTLAAPPPSADENRGYRDDPDARCLFGPAGLAGPGRELAAPESCGEGGCKGRCYREFRRGAGEVQRAEGEDAPDGRRPVEAGRLVRGTRAEGRGLCPLRRGG